MNRPILLALATLAVSMSPVFGATRHVPSQYPTIQAAVDAALPGDLVLIAPGTYTGVGNRGVTITKSLTIRGAGQTSTTLSCNYQDRGFHVSGAAVSVRIAALRIEHGLLPEDIGGGGLYCTGAYVELDSVTIYDSGLIGNYSSSWWGGGMYCENAIIRMRWCAIVGNGSLDDGAGIYATSCTLDIRDCDISGNSSPEGGRGGGVCAINSTVQMRRTNLLANGNDAGGGLYGSGSLTIRECNISDNYAYHGAGVSADIDTLIGTLFDGNSGKEGFVQGAAVNGDISYAANNVFRSHFSESTPPTATLIGNIGLLIGNAFYQNCADDYSILFGSARTISSNTFVLNCVSGLGHFLLEGKADIDHNIFYSLDDRPIISSSNPDSITVWCNDFFSGVVTPDLSGFVDLGGNIFADPLFCDQSSGDFTLTSISPCLDGSCGTMGAFGLGCYHEKPGIISINDVGNDQGRQVRITWYRSLYDAPASGVDITGYAIYRQQNGLSKTSAGPSDVNRRGEGLAIPGWDYVATAPNRGDSTYSLVVPTLCDSTLAAGMCWTMFLVSALTTSPFTFFDSPIDSGYSKDNLAPPTPTSFAVSYNTGSGNSLAWDAVAAPDFAAFHVYRGTSPGFTPTPATQVGTTTQTTWSDPSYDGWGVYYKVTSADVAGNESAPAISGAVTGTRNTPRLLTLSLGPSVPNPFNPTTRIPFVVPSSGKTRLAIYDVAGALVRVLVDEVVGPGAHEALWDGRDDAGGLVSSGVYLCRLEHPQGFRTSKIVAVK